MYQYAHKTPVKLSRQTATLLHRYIRDNCYEEQHLLNHLIF